MLIFKKDACTTMRNHAHNNTRDTCVVNIYIYLLLMSVIYITCEHEREIMLENTEHNMNNISLSLPN